MEGYVATQPREQPGSFSELLHGIAIFPLSTLVFSVKFANLQISRL